MSWYCASELSLANPTQVPYPCCVFGVAPLNHTTYTTQLQCQDNTLCCNNANQPGTNNLDPCCGGIDQGDPCGYHAWLSITQPQRDAICQYCMGVINDPCVSEVSAFCRCCDGCSSGTTTTTTSAVNRGVRMCPQFGTMEFMAVSWFPTLYAIVWSYPIGTILEMEVSFISFYDGSVTYYRACWEVVEFTAIYVCAEADGILLNPVPVTCKSCTIPPVDVCITTTTTDRPPPAPYWCVEKCCDGTIHKIDATFPYDWTGVITGPLWLPSIVWTSQSFNNLNGTGLQECYTLPSPPIFDCGNYPILALAPPVAIFFVYPGHGGCDECLNMYECNQVGDVYQWFPPLLPPPTGAAVDTGANDDLCQCTTTTTTSMVTTTTTSCIFGCTDVTACNYDPNATCNDGSCTAQIWGCMDSGACIGTACPDDGTCTNPIGWFLSPWPGCAAFNYYAGANQDDGSCFGYCNCLEPAGTNYNFTGEIGIPQPGGFTNGVYLDCAGVIQMTGINWNGNAGNTSCCGPIVTTTTTVCIWGCIDSTSLNFDPLATCDDGSCIPIIYGCMDDGCCTTGIGPDPLVGDSCPGGTTGLYHLCPVGGPNQPSYNSPTPPPTTAMNYNPAVNVDGGTCVYLALNITFFEVPYPPCIDFFGPICCASTYDINVQMANGLTIPQGIIEFRFEAYTTNPGTIYTANLGVTYTHNTVSTSLDFNDQAFNTCVMSVGTTLEPWMTGLPNCISYEGAVPVKVIVHLQTTSGVAFMGEAVLQDFTTASNISVGYNNNWDGTNTQTCDPTASSPGGIGGCV